MPEHLAASLGGHEHYAGTLFDITNPHVVADRQIRRAHICRFPYGHLLDLPRDVLGSRLGSLG